MAHMFNQYALLNVGPMIRLIHILQCTRPYIDSFETNSSKSGIFEGADSGLIGGESTHKLVNIMRMSGVL